jgi:hypothetical protein
MRRLELDVTHDAVSLQHDAVATVVHLALEDLYPREVVLLAVIHDLSDKQVP